MLRWPTVPRNPRSSETREAPDESSPNEETMPGSREWKGNRATLDDSVRESLGGGLIWIWEWGNSLIILYSREATSGFWGDFWENLYGSVYTGWNTPFEILLRCCACLVQILWHFDPGWESQQSRWCVSVRIEFRICWWFPISSISMFQICPKYVPNTLWLFNIAVV